MTMTTMTRTMLLAVALLVGIALQLPVVHAGGYDVPYNSDRDYCKTGEEENGVATYGPCDPDKDFPKCSNYEFICFNRINRRDKFYPDKQPEFFINPRLVKCYPENWIKWGGCSSCSPGRYCKSEWRCILDERDYPCETWW